LKVRGDEQSVAKSGRLFYARGSTYCYQLLVIAW